MSEFTLKNAPAAASNAHISANFNPATAARLGAALARHGFHLPAPTTDGQMLVTPLCDVSAEGSSDVNRLIPGLSVIYQVPDHYAAADNRTAFAPLYSLTMSPTTDMMASGRAAIVDSSGKQLAVALSQSSALSGLEGVFRVIELLEQATHHLSTLEPSEQSAREAFEARVTLCKSVIDAVHTARSETPVFYPVFLTVAGNPLNPKNRSNLVRCGDRWAIGGGVTEDKQVKMVQTLVDLVQSQCKLTPNKPYLRKLNSTFQLFSPAKNPSIRTCGARIYRQGQTPVGTNDDGHTNALCAHLGAVANFLGQDGIDNVFNTLHASFPSLLDITEQTVVSRLKEHIGIPATILTLVGSSGTGKTEGVHDLNKHFKIQLPNRTAMHSFQCHPGATASDMIGRINQVLHDGNLRAEWADGPLAKAWKSAAGSATKPPKLTIFFADEINRMPMAELQAFIAMLSPDKEGYLYLQTRKSVLSPLTGEYEVEVLRAPAKNLIFISAMNAGAGFQVEQLDLAIFSRMRIIFIGYNVDSLVATLKYQMNVDAADIPVWNSLLTGFLASVLDNTLRAPLDLRQINRILEELKHANLPKSFNNEDKIAFGMMKAISDFVTFTSTGALSESEIEAILVIISSSTPNRTISSLDDLYAEGQEAIADSACKHIVDQFLLN